METNETKQGKMPLKTIVGYGLGEAGCQFSWALISSYLTVFYTDVVGLMPAVISAIMLIARVWDAINDPMFGNLAENHTRSRWGRFRPYILFGTPLLALFNCLTFLNLDISNTAKTIWCSVTYICCGMVYTAVGISVANMPNCMTTSNKDRVHLQGSRNLAAGIANIIISAVAMPLILYFGNGSASSGRGYFLAAVVFSVCAIPCLWICFASVREKIQQVPTEKDAEKKTGLTHSFVQVFKDHDARLLVLAMMFALTAIMGRMGIMAYYFIYVLGDAGKMAACMTAMSIGTLLPAVYCPVLLNRFDKKYIGAIGSVGQILCCVALYFAAEVKLSLVALIVLHFIWGILNTQPMTCYTLVAEIMDDNWLRTGHRADGTLSACLSFGTKLGNAIGGSVGVLALSAVGFVANTDMSAGVLTNMNKVINLAPCIFYLIAAILFMMIKMTNKKGKENEEKIKVLLENQGQN